MSASESSSSSPTSLTNAVKHDEKSSAGSSRSRSSSPSPSPFEPPSELLDEYTRLLAGQFDLASTGLIPTQPPRYGSDDEDAKGEGGRPMTKAEKQNAKKKRRKERERLAREQVALAERSNAAGQADIEKNTFGFRLFSSCPIQSVSIVRPEELYPLPSNPRHQGYTDTELAHRREVANEAAVEWPQLGGPSTHADRWTRTDRPVRQMITDPRTRSELPALVLGSMELPSDRMTLSQIASRVAKGRKTPASQVKPHGFRINLIETGKVGTRKGTRRGRKRKSRERPMPAYWTSTRDGRSTGIHT